MPELYHKRSLLKPPKESRSATLGAPTPPATPKPTRGLAAIAREARERKTGKTTTFTGESSTSAPPPREAGSEKPGSFLWRLSKENPTAYEKHLERKRAKDEQQRQIGVKK